MQSAVHKTGHRYIIIGSGMSGILIGIRLKMRGEHDFVILEKASMLGGVWRENTYPGLTCDVPAHSYTYSFARNPDWSAYYAPGPEVREYFEEMAKRFEDEMSRPRMEDYRMIALEPAE